MTPTIELKAEPIEGGYALLYDEKPKSGDWYYDNILKAIIHWVGIYAPATYNPNNCKKIIASDDKSLGLPYILWPDEDEEAAEKEYPANSLMEVARVAVKRDSFVAGRKSSTKKFDENDMLKCWTDSYSNTIISDTGTLVHKISFKDYLQSLTPTIISVEVVAEEIHYCKVCNSMGLRHCAHPEECNQVIDEIARKLYPDELHGYYKVLKVNYIHETAR